MNAALSSSVPQEPSARWRPWLTVAAAAVLLATLLGLGSMVADDVAAPVGHAMSHAAIGVPIGALLFAALRRWPPARTMRPGRAGRGLVIAGLAGFFVGQVAEIAGARVDEPGATAVEGIAHTAGMIITTLSLPVIALGTVASLAAAARDGAVPRWTVVLVAVTMAGLILFMIVGAPDGS